MVTWGTNPEAVVTIVDRVPDPDRLPDPDAASQARRMLDYMGLTPGTLIEGLPIDVVFIGSCNNSRIEEDRKSVVKGKGVSVRLDLGGCRIIKKKNTK